MSMKRKQRFVTARLLVDEWHSFTDEEWAQQNHAQTVQDILTPAVTKNLPPSWQGHFTHERAQQWADERDNEGSTLLAIDQSNKKTVGIIILFETEDQGHFRLGYMLKESAWGKGFASELIGGFVGWCRTSGIKSLTGGVERNNVASRRVLEKCGFVLQTCSKDKNEQMFILNLK